MPLLAKDFSVIAIDFPGFGRSEMSTTFRYTYENYAKLVIACMDYFKLHHASLVGHSMGGQIAMYTTRMIPARIDKLVLINSSAYWGKVHKWARIATLLPFFHLITKHIVQKNDVRDTLENVLYDHSLITEEMIEEYSMPLREKRFYKALGRFLRHREGDLHREQLKDIQTPALLLWGDADNVVPLSAGKKLKEDLPNATLFHYEKAGHLLTDERPQAIVEEIIAWCLHDN